MKIAILDGAQLNPGDLSWKEIQDLGNVEIFDSTPLDLIVERSKNAEIVITNKVPFDMATIDLLPNLKCILVSATGYNIIDTKHANAKNIIVCNAPSYSNESVAQHVFALILAIYNKVESYASEVRSGKWSDAGDWSYSNEPVENLNGKTLGIVGFGQIGQRVSEIAQIFGMKVIAHHKHPHRDSRPEVGFVDLETLFSNSDIITLHVPLNEQTQHIVNSKRLKLMKNSSILVNTGRGPLVDENALAYSLKNEEIRAAGLDVLSSEPPKHGNPLFECSNCYITPHLAWAGVGARQNLMDILCDNVKGMISGEPINVVN